MIDTINELSHIFKQLNQLVIDQGTLLDRIDYNIEETVENTKKAKKSLIKVISEAQNHNIKSNLVSVRLMIISKTDVPKNASCS